MHRAIRLLDLGEVSYLRSQTIYHAVAGCLDDDGPDTIILMSPRQPYACIGYHQDLDQEIDLDYCRRRGLPVLRREVGGGTVYLDGEQLFYHFIFHQQRAPRRPDEAYRYFLAGPIRAYQQLGVEARLASLNDIVVGDRKIGGTGAGTIARAAVVCGSIISDFDHDVMAGLLRAPSPAFRAQAGRMMRRYITSLRAELGQAPPSAEVRAALIAHLAQALEADLVPGELCPREWAAVAELDARFTSDQWLRAIRRPTPTVRQVKVRAGVLVCEAMAEAEGRCARLTLSLVDGIIVAAELTGDAGSVTTRLVGAPLASALTALPAAEADDPVLALACLASIRKVVLKGVEWIE